MADALRLQLNTRFPNDQRFSVVGGDSNETLPVELLRLSELGLDYAPTFAFVDPNAFQTTWDTLARLASFKRPDARTKTEMWILFASTSIPRLAGLDDAFGTATADRASRLLGTESWRRIHERRAEGSIDAPDARRLYIDLFRNRIQHVLGYRSTQAIDLCNERGSPVYTMVFVTDSNPGDRIMESVYRQMKEQSAELRGELLADRARNDRLVAGRPNLWDAADDSLEPVPVSYEVLYRKETPSLPGWLPLDA